MKREELKEYLLENVEDLKEIVSQINSWNGDLEHLRFYENDEEFFQMAFENNIDGAVRATQYGEYNYNDEYVRFNGYGNLDSANEWEVNKEMKECIDEILDSLESEYGNLHLDSEIEEFFEEDEEEEEE